MDVELFSGVCETCRVWGVQQSFDEMLAPFDGFQYLNFVLFFSRVNEFWKCRQPAVVSLFFRITHHQGGYALCPGYHCSHRPFCITTSCHCLPAYEIQDPLFSLINLQLFKELLYSLYNTVFFYSFGILRIACDSSRTPPATPPTGVTDF